MWVNCDLISEWKLILKFKEGNWVLIIFSIFLGIHDWVMRKMKRKPTLSGPSPNRKKAHWDRKVISLLGRWQGN